MTTKDKVWNVIHTLEADCVKDDLWSKDKGELIALITGVYDSLREIVNE